MKRILVHSFSGTVLLITAHYTGYVVLIQYNVFYRFVVYGLSYVEVFSQYSGSLRDFYRDGGMLYFVKGFFCIHYDDGETSILQSTHLICRCRAIPVCRDGKGSSKQTKLGNKQASLFYSLAA